jgi:hypothetical protein
MKQSEIRSRIADAIDDPDMIFMTEAQLNHSIDEAMEVIAEKTRNIRRTAYVSLREGVNFYFLQSIAPDMMYPYRIWNQQNNLRLIPTTIDEMDERHRTWMETSGNPECWFPVSWDYFGIYPHPAAAGGVLRVDYIAWPRALMDDDDEPELPESSSDALSLYGITEGQLKEWDAKSAMANWAMFARALGESNARTGVNRVQIRRS